MNGFSVDGCTRNWINGGAPPSAINIGLPFYGRSFLKAKGLNEPHEGNDKNTWFWDDGSPQYFNIVDKLSDLVSVRHEPTKTQYAYKDSTTGGLVSYDDEEAICDKTEYVSHYFLRYFQLFISIHSIVSLHKLVLSNLRFSFVVSQLQFERLHHLGEILQFTVLLDTFCAMKHLVLICLLIS